MTAWENPTSLTSQFLTSLASLTSSVCDYIGLMKPSFPFRVDNATLKRLALYARVRETSMNKLLTEIVDDWLKDRPPEETKAANRIRAVRKMIRK